MPESKILTGMRQAVEHVKGAAQHPFAAAAAVFATADAAEEAEHLEHLDAWAREIAASINGGGRNE